MEIQKNDLLVRESEAAQIIGAAKSSLKQSRHTGILFGAPAPPFTKLGRSVRYKLSALLKFREQFPEYQNTAQINEETR